MGFSLSRKDTARSQIALEFIIVYSFVLIVFLVMFGIAATQRATTMENEQYSNLQMIAQNIATYIDQAMASGSGFNSTITLPPSIGTEPYLLSITSTGIVTVNISVGGRAISATAYSNSGSIVSNDIISGSNPTTYLLPTYKGTVSITNYNGQIYVDKSPPQAGSLPNYMVTSQDAGVYAANFNGQSSYVNLGSSSNYLSGNFTVALWAYPNAKIWHYMFGNGEYNTAGAFDMVDRQDTSPPRYCIYYDTINSEPKTLCTTVAGSANEWSQVVATYDGSTLKIYVNGVFENSVARSGNFTGSYAYIGEGYSAGRPWLGNLSNVQIYDTVLTSNEVSALYNEGISGKPLNMQYLSGWWPLNGNTNDYSKNNNAATSSEISYIPTVKVTSHVFLTNGANAISTAAGLITPSANAIGYTNTSGVMSAFLTSNDFMNQNLTAYAYNGNATLVGNLVGWWPLTLGYGNTLYDLSGHHNIGTATNVVWQSMPTNATNILTANFNGQNSYIKTSTSHIPTGSSAVSVFAWFDETGKNVGGGPTVEEEIYCLGSSSYDNACLGIYQGKIYFDNAGSNQGSSGFVVTNNTWNFAGFTYISGSSNVTMYLNGQKSIVTLGSPPLTTNNGSIIGSWPDNLNYYHFNGSIANIQVYNTTLSTNEANSLYNEGITGMPLNTQNLVGWWPLNGNANDYSINNNSATNSVGVAYKNTAIYNTNQNMTVANFNGQSSYIQVPDSASLRVGDPDFTFSAWVYPLNTSSYTTGEGGIIFNKENTYEWTLGSNGNLCWAIDNSNPGWTWECTQIYVPTDKWTYVVLTYNGSYVMAYKNGAPDPGGGYAASGVISTTYQNALRIGARGAPGTVSDYALFNGSIANVQIYNKALSQQQISELYYQGLPLISKMNLSLG